MKKNIKYDFFWNTLGTALNTFSSLFLMIAITRINGLNDAGIFSIAFATACVLFVLGTYSGRIYQVTDLSKTSDKEYIYHKIITCILMILLVILFVLIRGYSLYKSVIFILLVIYKSIEAFCDVLYGIMQKNLLLYKAGKSIFLKALVGIIFFVLTDLFLKNIIISLIAMIIPWLLILIFYDLRLVKKLTNLNKKVNWNKIKKLLKNGFLPFIISFSILFVVQIPKFILDYFESDSVQAIFGIIIMPATAISLFSQFIIQPFLNKINEYNKNNEYKKFQKIMVKILISILIVGMICFIGAYLIGIYILEFIYGVELSNYKLSLLIILLASTFNTMAGILSSFLIVLRKNLIQIISFFVIFIIEIFLGVVLTKEYGINGLCASYLFSMIIYFTIFIFATLKIIRTSSSFSYYDNNLHTFVILAYKESKYLEKCIKSVLNQKYKSNVVIATTTDNKFIRNLANKYKLDVIVGKHTNIGGDFDFAISCANTELVTVAHQDDIYDCEYSKNIVDLYKKNKSATIIFSDYYEIRNNKKTFTNLNLKIKRLLLFPLRFNKLSKYKYFKRFVLKYGNSICCPAVTFVKNNCPKEIFNSKYKCDVDWFAWEKLSKLNGKFIYCSKKLMGHRISETSTTTDIINNGIRIKEDYDMYLKFWPKFIAKQMTKLYKNSEKSNNLKE